MIVATISFALFAVIVALMLVSVLKIGVDYQKKVDAVNRDADDAVLDNFAVAFKSVHESKDFSLYNDLISSLEKRIKDNLFLTPHGKVEAAAMLEIEQEILVKLHKGEL